ncbi:TLC ATP/ADP transporter isoform 2 [Theobroma cacao]|uniref:ADP,ATP carrier protein n=1 Tax=Theobroma cacao TaxID=3641 RepID=A0A061GAK0_THECC|nr:TLC ATP/ADP transporter isoform 2 [Theobroma cacao]
MEAVLQTRGLLSLPPNPTRARSLLNPSQGLKQRLFASKPLGGLSLSYKKVPSVVAKPNGLFAEGKNFICKAEAAAAADGQPLFGEIGETEKPKFLGIELVTLKKIIPLGLMFFCILFNYTILRDTKDVLVVTAKGSSAEIIPFLKTWVNLPMAVGFMLLYTKLANVLSKQALFYTVIVPFIAFFGAFGFMLYPLSNYIHPQALSDKLLAVLGPRFLGPLAIMRIWSFCLFYVMAELWGSVVISVLFWGLANQITTVDEAKRFYPLFGLGANIALIFSGRTVKYFSNLRKNLGPGVDGWAISLKGMMSIVVLMGLAICFLYWWVNKFVPLPTRSKKKKEKPKMGTMESLKFLVSSRYIRDLATLVVAYGISINLVEVTWKSKQVKGKAAIDVVCNPLGKSGGALIQQFMILTFGSLANSTPYLGGVLLVIVLAWLSAAKSLDTQFTALRKEEELEKEMERAAVKIPVVSESGNGSLASGSSLNPAAGDSTGSSSETSTPSNI